MIRWYSSCFITLCAALALPAQKLENNYNNMILKQIHIEKSRTIKVDGYIGRDAYRKVVIGMDAEVDCMVHGEIEQEYNALSDLVDDKMAFEVNKLNKKKK